MQRDNLPAFSNLLLSLYRIAQESPIAQFHDAALELLKDTLPFHSSMWGTATMTAGGIDIHNIHLHNMAPAMLAAYEQVKHQDTAAARVTTMANATLGFDAATEFAGEDQQEIRAFAREFGRNHFFITSDAHPLTRFAQWISLFRTDPAQPCTPGEVQLLAELAPHLMQALAINRRIHLDRVTGDVAREAWSVAMADTRGVIHHADDAFLRLMRREWAEAVDHPGHLPAAALRALEQNDRLVGRQVVVQRTLEHGLLFLKARERHPVDSLSTREYAVARMLSDGLTHKEVAVRLNLSPSTVSTHARVVFDKLDIHNVVLLPQLLALRL